MGKVIAVGIDLAKDIVCVYGVDERCNVVLRKSLEPAAIFDDKCEQSSFVQVFGSTLTSVS